MGRSIPRYICTTCGKGYASARSTRRHIRDIEMGQGQVCPEEQFRIMLASGAIAPPIAAFSKPMYKPRRKDFGELAYEEFLRGYYRKLGEKAAEKLPDAERTVLIKMFCLKAANEIGKEFKNP